jgi:hypothetical protein
MIGRRVNACASPDWPKPLYQWGAFGSPLIQSFGCSMAHAGPDSARKTNTQVYFSFAKGIVIRTALALWQHLATLDSRLRSNRHFTFQALPTSVLKLETSCQRENCCQGHSHTSWLIGFRPRVHARAWSRAFCFDCFFS